LQRKVSQIWIPELWLNGCNESGSDCFRLCDSSAYDHGEGAEIEGAAEIIGLADVAFDDDRNL
jgi:hypothetical protein